MAQRTCAKLECAGHVQKHVGRCLRKFKMTVRGLGGKEKLTDALKDWQQNCYGTTIKVNVGGLQAMAHGILANLFHCSSTDEYPQSIVWALMSPRVGAGSTD